MNKVKIIHILPHFPNPVVLNYNKPESYFLTREQGKYRLLNYQPFWVGFFALDHHAIAAKDLLNLTDEFEIECWRPYGLGLKEPHEEIVNRIKHRIFPAYKFTIPQIGSLTWSNELFNALVEEICNNKVIVNLSVGHAWFNIKMMLKLKKYKSRFGLVAIQRSGGFRHLSYKNLETWKKIFKWYYYLESIIDAYSLQFCDIYYIGAKPEAEYVAKIKKKIPGKFFMEGINFEKYKVLNQYEKHILRKELNLPVDKKLLIAYGNWLSTDYGYQHLLEVFREIKKTPDGIDLELVMIGGYKSQDLYEVGISSGAIMIERVNKSDFIRYIEAADLFGQPMLSWDVMFGGVGTAMIEGWACGLPAISDHIMHYPGNETESKKMGKRFSSKKELYDAIIYIKNNLHKYKDCRELAKKYYDINNTRMVLLSKYRELAMKYFGVDTSIQNTKSTV
jgi:hypothetical protein